MKLEYPHKCLNILGNEIRIKIINLLKEKPRTVLEICEKTSEEQSTISHSLQKLRKCKFVNYKKQGKERIYFINSKIFFENSNKNILELIEEHVKNYCEEKNE
ncbi:MAG: metalloregulator ArsR/SmtB family transcription factor [Candidatus ainarchaeum sp.]|nr:metalloregulator ArsR/SmtB family transcription factor [Candidatus ainarchaeum sp.]